MTEVGEYLGKQQKDKEDIGRQFRSGSVATDYRFYQEKIGVTDTVGVKTRTVETSFILGHGGGDVQLGVLAGSGAFIGQWKMNDNLAGSEVLDTTGNVNGYLQIRTGSFVSLNTQDYSNASGKINRCLTFPGNRYYDTGIPGYTGSAYQIQFNNGQIKPLSYLNDCSMGCWFKTSQANRTDVQSANTMGLMGFTFRYAFNFQSVGIGVGTRKGGGETIDQVIENTINVHDGEWHHVFTTYSTSGSILSLYVDGNLVGSTVTDNDFLTDTGFNIGNVIYSGNTQSFTGSIDDVRVYHSKLSADEVASIYNSGNGTENPIKVIGTDGVSYTENGQATMGNANVGITVKEGELVYCIRNAKITSLTKHASSTATIGYIHSSDQTILGSAAFSGDIASFFNSPVLVSSGAAYYLMVDAGGATYNSRYHNATSYPYTNQSLVYASGTSNFINDTRAYNIISNISRWSKTTYGFLGDYRGAWTFHASGSF